MARIKLAYIGGGSTRAPGTLASLLHRGAEFNGSEVVLIDLDRERLEVVQTIARKIAHNQNFDFTITTTTDRPAGLRDCDAVLGTLIPRVAEFEVTGVFETGMYEYDNAYVFVELEAAQEFAGLDSAVTGLEVATTDR